MLVGIDIIDIDRVRKAVERAPRFLSRIYTQQEIEYCFSKSDPYPSLAVRFAAREAVRKLDPVFCSGILFKEIEIFIHEDGRPELIMHGAALEKCSQHGISDFSISLSHSKTQAVAAVIARKEVIK
ncbi:MAG: holo-ACP synthase [Syntrophomonadaceae bacterium]|nr:holo-ACP synthase [Syntrophomonadaceae bacterium]MDD3022626.1 holo-ACP synthase [Syntrophomonadaceae bacterium]